METTTRDKGNRLGRGFSALLPNAPAAAAQQEAPRPAGGVVQLAIEDIQPDKLQPRRRFEESKIEELASSIRSKGVIQPILVRKDGAKYRIIAGERRWRASQRAGLKYVPVLIKEVTERQAFELALIENIQREDLNPVEEAESYRRLIEEHSLTQEACAERVGKDRSSIANSLRLLRLPDEIKDSLIEGSLNMGHARALLGLTDDDSIKRAAREVSAKKLSVRQTEQLVRRAKESKPDVKGKGSETAAAPSPQVRSVEEKLQRALGTKVRLTDKGGGKGKLEIEFFSYEELDRILAAMGAG
ncbi:ParB/RepB/Spo0J family partition protein [Vulgatibacter sp.]|uniref:ParB/RepB/Spo0J family partition protein n=1 Tax=Vulgatibacter sp. TaxID=1971226 RepID=UPI0035644BCE